MRDLSREVRRLAGWFGLKRNWRQAWEQVAAEAEAAGLSTSVDALGNDSLIAVVEAATASAERQGRNVELLRAELRTFRSAPRDADDVRRLHDLARKALGFRACQRAGPSSLGVGGAALALLTSEVPVAAGVAEARQLLLRPWQKAVMAGNFE